jgi:hypothetical protein
LGFPLKGIGAKYGASVSTNILSSGISLNVSAKTLDFLKVTTPLAEIYAPMSSRSKANFFEPVKQCIKILKSFFFFFFF